MKADERTRLLLEAKTLQDLLFRSRYDPQENSREVNLREHGERFLLTAEYTVPDFTRIFGKDTSHWDGNIDQAASKAAGVRFAWAKAMDGTVPSKYFKENKARAREAGLPEGPYNWLYPNGLLSCKLQADTLHNYLQPLPKSDLPLMVDWEWTRWSGQPANPNMTDLEIFVDQWLSRGNRKPVLYTAFGYSALFGAMPKRLRDKFEGVCAASYGGTSPSMPLGWLEWILWQFTAHAEAARFSPNDANKLNLDLIYVRDAQTLEKLGGSIIEPEPEPDPTEDPMPEIIKEGTVSALKLGGTPHLNIRDGAGGSGLFNDIGNLYPRDRVYGWIVSAVWLEFNKIIRANGAIENVHGFASAQYMDVRDVPIEPPAPTERTVTGGLVRFSDGTTQELIVKP